MPYFTELSIKGMYSKVTVTALRGLDGRGKFWTIWISYEEELSLKIKRKSSNFKVKTYWILLYLIKCQDYF